MLRVVRTTRSLIVITATLYRRAITVQVFQAAKLLFTWRGPKNNRSNHYQQEPFPAVEAFPVDALWGRLLEGTELDATSSSMKRSKESRAGQFVERCDVSKLRETVCLERSEHR